jgi:hypothetical protein
MTPRPCTQILVSLLNADPTALTAMGCLRHSLGYGERLIGLQRSVLWELNGPAGDEAAGAADLLRRGGEIWNPNKEGALIRYQGRPPSALGPRFQAGSPFDFWLAWDPERDLSHRIGALAAASKGKWRLARGTLWVLQWRDEDPEARRRLSEQAVVCRGPSEGLLVHPHLEDYRRINWDDPMPWLPARA